MKNSFKEFVNINIIAIFLIALVFCIFFVGYKNISPYNNEWLFGQPDMLTHYLGWCYFKNDSWHFPFGLNPNYAAVNNSIVYSDSIPLMAFIFKIFKSFFSNDFNYFSIWIFICFFLQGFFSYKIIYHYTKDNFYSLFVTLFFLTSPIFLQKMSLFLAHGAHFIILCAIYIPTIKSKITRSISWYFLIFISLLVNFYFFIMVSIIFALFLSKEMIEERNYYLIFKKLSVFFILIFSTMYISGYFTMSPINLIGAGFGFFKFNLLGFFDPVQVSGNSALSTTGFGSWSLFIKDLPSYSGEYVGFAYLGLGVILLLILTLSQLFKEVLIEKKLSSFANKKIYFFLFFIFLLIALSTNIDLGHIKILEIELNKYFIGLTGTIRGSGRFILPAYYLIFIFVFIFLFKKYSSKYIYTIIIISLIFQIVDTSPGIKQILNGKKFVYKKNILADSFWNNLKNEKLIKSTYEINANPDLYPLADYLCKNNIKTNMFYLARYDRFKTSNNRYENYKKIYEKKIDNHPYIVSTVYNHLLDIKDRYKNNNLGIFFRDNIWIIYKGQKKLMNESDILNIEKINFPTITKQKIITPKKNNKYFGIGWKYDSKNPNFIWSDGYISSLLFNVSNKIDQTSLEIEIDKNQINQNILEFDIMINDTLYKRQTIYKGETEKFYIDLDIEKHNNFRIDFLFKDLISEFEKRDNINNNKFGFLIKSIKLK